MTRPDSNKMPNFFAFAYAFQRFQFEFSKDNCTYCKNIADLHSACILHFFT